MLDFCTCGKIINYCPNTPIQLLNHNRFKQAIFGVFKLISLGEG